MTKFVQKTFSVPLGDSKAYRDNYDKVFGKKKQRKAKDEEERDDDETEKE